MWFCLACFLPSGWSGIPAHRCCSREQTTATCGCGRYRPESARPSRALRARQPPAKSCLMVTGGGVMTNAETKLHQNVRNTINSSPGKRAVVGYEDGTVRVWDLKQGNAIHVIKGEFFYFDCPDVIIILKVFRKTFESNSLNGFHVHVRSGWPPGGADLPCM